MGGAVVASKVTCSTIFKDPFFATTFFRAILIAQVKVSETERTSFTERNN